MDGEISTDYVLLSNTRTMLGVARDNCVSVQIGVKLLFS